jgi:hypothetical protein
LLGHLSTVNKGIEKAGFRKLLEQHDNSETLSLPLHHLDKHFYTESRVERGYLEFLEIQQILSRGCLGY